MSDDTVPGPDIGTLRAASASLMAAQLGDGFREQLARAAELARYHLIADALGVPRDRAAEILRNAQGQQAGSTPTVQHLERARRDLLGAHDLVLDRDWSALDDPATARQPTRRELNRHRRMIGRCFDVPPAPAATARPTVCPCGHPVGDEYLCIEGRIYGPCDSEFCGGVCEYDGECKGECACGEDE